MKEIRPAWIAAAVLGVVVVVFLLGKVSESVSPEPVALWVAIQPAGSATAYVGPVELPAGSAFKLHAVVEAESFKGERIYYTEADQLEFPDRVPETSAIRRWHRALEPRTLWFTVDGSPPFRTLAAGKTPEPPGFEETFRADWAQAWTVSGDLRPVVENYLPDSERAERSVRFGTQRFHVRMEFFANRGDLVPQLRLQSWGAEELPARSADFPAVVATLGGSLRVPSRVFGLAQVEADGAAVSDEFGTRLTAWTRDLVAFSRITVLAEWLRAEGISWDSLVWSDVEVGVSEAPVAPGDLLRVGNRIVWILEDRGQAGRLDYDDLCIDFDRGARVVRLGSVFAGEGLVAWAQAPRSGGRDKESQE
ncbi:MAG: hypothetical protein ACE5GX_17100 [Thermoanaerobaculia bacterium]